MTVGILSDIHDALLNLDRALLYFEQNRISTLFFCGDFCSPIPCRRLKAFPGTVHAVFGNGDGDRFQMMNIAHAGETNLHFHGEYADLTLSGKRIGMTHYPFYARYMALSQEFDAVFCGHSHEASTNQVGKTLLINPGDIMGWKNPPSIGTLNLETLSYNGINI